MKKIITTYCILFLALTPLLSQSRSELERQRKETERQLEETSKLLQETQKNETATTNKLNLLNRDIQTRKKLIAGISQEIASINDEMSLLQKEHNQLSLKLDSVRQDYANLIRQTHYAQLQNSPLLFVLSAGSFHQLARRIRYMQQFADYRKQQAAQIESLQKDIQSHNKRLEQDRHDRNAILAKQQRERDNLARDERKQKQMLKDLQKQEKQLRANLKKQQKKANELNKKIDELIAQENKKQKGLQLTKEQQLVAGGFEKNKGKLPWPVEKGFISGHYGIQQHPTLPHVEINNKGIYIQTSAGSMARAVYEGTVTAIFPVEGQYAVIIQHGNYRTIYSNLSSVKVKQGEKVSTKQVIGKIYTNPQEDNKTEIFFQIRKDTSILNPSLWIAR